MELIVPMLAEPLPVSRIEKLLSDDNWRAEWKVDGDRLMVHVDNHSAFAVNRKGEITTFPSKAIADAFAALPGQWVFDGESVSREFYIWDMPVANQLISPSSPFEDRRVALEAFFEGVDLDPTIHLITSYRDEADKRALYDRVMKHGGEGIMLKDVNAPYFSGKVGYPKRTDRVRKVKFWKSVDVIITELHREGKDNAVMELLCPGDCVHTKCNGRVEVGTISRIGKGSVQVGDVVEVKFLYCVNPNKPKLVQPTILRKRTDKGLEECTVDQLDTCFTVKTGVEVVR